MSDGTAGEASHMNGEPLSKVARLDGMLGGDVISSTERTIELKENHSSQAGRSAEEATGREEGEVIPKEEVPDRSGSTFSHDHGHSSSSSDESPVKVLPRHHHALPLETDCRLPLSRDSLEKAAAAAAAAAAARGNAAGDRPPDIL
ncbi:PREDICTED: uncharacterized protein LOC106819070 [Priapulus caudatus]|uniref:Uncharacterized protein LOC106819070 n=1 Tax=Priapulus caudatus TaxID=37621 RepID=A0ABM1F445_PRICU|nr:PREDICTED: uncharacterized protein LOC106819070 [Priapulus caudatus]